MTTADSVFMSQDLTWSPIAIASSFASYFTCRWRMCLVLFSAREFLACICRSEIIYLFKKGDVVTCY